MVILKVSDQKGVSVTLTGTAPDITRQVLMAIGSVYSSLKKQNEESAEFFQTHAVLVMLDREFWEIAARAEGDGIGMEMHIPVKHEADEADEADESDWEDEADDTGSGDF